MLYDRKTCVSGKTVILNAGIVRAFPLIHRELSYSNVLYSKFPVVLGTDTLTAVIIDFGKSNICILELEWAQT